SPIRPVTTGSAAIPTTTRRPRNDSVTPGKTAGRSGGIEAPPHRRNLSRGAQRGGPRGQFHAGRAGRADRRRGCRPPAGGLGAAVASRPPAETEDASAIQLRLPQAGSQAGHLAVVRLRLRGPARLRRFYRAHGNGEIASAQRRGAYGV